MWATLELSKDVLDAYAKLVRATMRSVSRESVYAVRVRLFAFSELLLCCVDSHSTVSDLPYYYIDFAVLGLDVL